MIIQQNSIFSHQLQWQLLNEKPSNEFKTLQLYVYSNKKKEFSFRTLIKTGSLILKTCKNNKIKYINVKNCILQKKTHPQNGEGIKIFSTNFFLEFYGSVTEWFQELKLHCIQIDFLNNYQICNLIGQGNFGKVYKAKCKSNQIDYAIKTFEKSTLKNQVEFDAILKEIDILRIVQHPRVIKLLETYESETHIFVVYELLKGGELKQLVKEKKLNQDQVISIIYKVIDALSYIHQQNIIHRDLKPENLIFRSPQNLEDIVIADFGLADFFRKDGQYLFTRCGTAGYLAPELIMNKLYDNKVDVYSLGVVFYTLLNGGKSPFEKQNQLEFNLDFSKLSITPDCLDLLSKMLDPNPQTRITSQLAKVHQLFYRQHQKIEFQTPRQLKTLSITTIQTSRYQKGSFTQPSNSTKTSPMVVKNQSLFIIRSPKQSLSSTKPKQ